MASPLRTHPAAAASRGDALDEVVGGLAAAVAVFAAPDRGVEAVELLHHATALLRADTSPDALLQLLFGPPDAPAT
eukprot:gene55421-58987_t